VALIDNLVAYYKLDEGNRANGDTAADSHGTNTLTQVGLATSVTGIINTALSVASLAYWGIANPSNFQLQSFSQSFWVKFTSFTDSMSPGISNSDAAWEAAGFGLYIQTSKLRFFTQDYLANYAESGTLSTGTWYHVVATRDSSSGDNRLYINGSLVDVKSQYATITYTGTNPFLAHLDAGADLNGVTDEVAFWSRAITAAEVRDLYNKGLGLAYNFTKATVDLEGFRFRNDDGDETAATWAAAQDANLTRDKAIATRLRVLLNTSGDVSTRNFRLEYRSKGLGGPWLKV
jgi:hypothetical protein